MQQTNKQKKKIKMKSTKEKTNKEQKKKRKQTKKVDQLQINKYIYKLQIGRKQNTTKVKTKLQQTAVKSLNKIKYTYMYVCTYTYMYMDKTKKTSIKNKIKQTYRQNKIIK